MVVVGGGSSSRFGSDKLLADVDGRPLLKVNVERVAPVGDQVVLVVREQIRDHATKLGLEATIVIGGSTRTQSEQAGLNAIDREIDLVGVHDAARPMVRPGLIEELFRRAGEVGGAVPLVESQQVLLSREGLSPIADLRRAQTPQVFRAGPLLASYELATQTGFEGHDTAEVVMEFSNLDVAWVPGDETNIKVTYPSDLDEVRTLVRNEPR